MDNISNTIKILIVQNKLEDLVTILQSDFDPNFEGGWPIQLAARYGFYDIVKTFIQLGTDPHLLGQAGASTLQLAVYSGKHWDTNKWDFLLASSESYELVDAAAVAIIFQNTFALQKILETGRCKINFPSTLTGKTIEQLADGYKLTKYLKTRNNNSASLSPTVTGLHNSTTLTPPQISRRNLSPSVAWFFDQTVRQASLTPQRRNINNTSPLSDMLNR